MRRLVARCFGHLYRHLLVGHAVIPFGFGRPHHLVVSVVLLPFRYLVWFDEGTTLSFWEWFFFFFESVVSYDVLSESLHLLCDYV
jgi:hypothetical protein